MSAFLCKPGMMASRKVLHTILKPAKPDRIQVKRPLKAESAPLDGQILTEKRQDSLDH